MTELGKKCIEAMQKVKNGADVYDRETAILLRQVERLRPEYISIVKPLGAPSGEKRQPYFGAILKKEGISALKRFTAATKNHVAAWEGR